MKHNLKKACKECPYVGKMPGWIGAHRDPSEFVILAQGDVAFPCHMTVNYEDRAWESKLDQAEQCPGQLAFMNKSHKLSRDRETAKQQREIGATIEVLWPPEHLVAVHRAGPVEGSKLRDAQKAKKTP